MDTIKALQRDTQTLIEQSIAAIPLAQLRQVLLERIRLIGASQEAAQQWLQRAQAYANIESDKIAPVDNNSIALLLPLLPRKTLPAVQELERLADSQAVWERFLALKAKGLTSEVCCVFMAGMLYHGDFKKIQAIFDDAVARQIDDQDVYSMLIKAALDLGYYDVAKQAYLQVQQGQKLNLNICVIAGRAISQLPDPALSEQIYHEAQLLFAQLTQAQADDYADLIAIAGYAGHYAEALELFESRSSAQLAADRHVFFAAAGVARRASNIGDLQKIVQRAQADQPQTIIQICAKLIQVAYTKGDNAVMNNAYTIIHASLLEYPCTETDCELLFGALSMAKHFEVAQAMFAQLTRFTVELYVSFIRAAGIARKLDVARATFEHARRHNMANHELYAALIQAAGSANDFVLAQRILQQAKIDHKVSALVYANFIKVACAGNKFDEAHQAFTEGEPLGLINHHAATSYHQAMTKKDEVLDEAFGVDYDML